jgi:hypothetical protein
MEDIIMKTKKSFEKKLVLKKRTITDLDNKELHKVVGGATYTCPTFVKTVCFTNCVTGCPRCPTEICM